MPPPTAPTNHLDDLFMLFEPQGVINNEKPDEKLPMPLITLSSPNPLLFSSPVIENFEGMLELVRQIITTNTQKKIPKYNRTIDIDNDGGNNSFQIIINNTASSINLWNYSDCLYWNIIGCLLWFLC